MCLCAFLYIQYIHIYMSKLIPCVAEPHTKHIQFHLCTHIVHLHSLVHGLVLSLSRSLVLSILNHLLLIFFECPGGFALYALLSVCQHTNTYALYMRIIAKTASFFSVSFGTLVSLGSLCLIYAIMQNHLLKCVLAVCVQYSPVKSSVGSLVF